MTVQTCGDGPDGHGPVDLICYEGDVGVLPGHCHDGVGLGLDLLPASVDLCRDWPHALPASSRGSSGRQLACARGDGGYPHQFRCDAVLSVGALREPSYSSSGYLSLSASFPVFCLDVYFYEIFLLYSS